MDNYKDINGIYCERWHAADKLVQSGENPLAMHLHNAEYNLINALNDLQISCQNRQKDIVKGYLIHSVTCIDIFNDIGVLANKVVRLQGELAAIQNLSKEKKK